MIFANKNEYEGEWKDNLRHGNGKAILRSLNAEYEGKEFSWNFLKF